MMKRPFQKTKVVPWTHPDGTVVELGHGDHSQSKKLTAKGFAELTPDQRNRTVAEAIKRTLRKDGWGVKHVEVADTDAAVLLQSGKIVLFGLKVENDGTFEMRPYEPKTEQ
jgi:hypothetical protein